MTHWTLQPAGHDSVSEVVAFIDSARRGLFPMLADSPMPSDLAHFAETYLEGEGHFFEARDQGHFFEARDQGQLIACVGYLPYDHRFAQLDYHGRRVVEVVRLFVLPEYRRLGLAAALFAALREHARAAAVECLYLHTHPFLPGAIRFWEQQGFALIDVEDDPVWRTTHMEHWLAR